MILSGDRRGPAAGTDFDGTRVFTARRLRGMSKADLAKALEVTPTAVAQYEHGTRPSKAVLAKMCLTLQMPREFFGAGNPLPTLSASSAHFRSLRSTSSKAREQVLAFGELSLELVDLISEYVDLPTIDLPHLDMPTDPGPDDIRAAANAVRTQWRIGNGPLPAAVQLLEAHGVLVLRLPEGTDPKVDAFSATSGGRPIVFLSPGKADRARSRFDAAHELGHLVMHPDTEPGSKVIEQQANAFAAELLMPAAEIRDQLPSRIDWPTFHALKRHWGVSLRALVYRAHNLERLSQASYRRANQQLSVWGLPEPGPLGPSESPQLLGMARQLLIENGISFDQILASGRIAVDVTDTVIHAGSAAKPSLILT